MPANAPHGTTSEYFTCSAEAISRITIVKLSIGNHVIAIIILGKSLYEFVALLKPSGKSSELVNSLLYSSVGSEYILVNVLTEAGVHSSLFPRNSNIIIVSLILPSRSYLRLA